MLKKNKEDKKTAEKEGNLNKKELTITAVSSCRISINSRIYGVNCKRKAVKTRNPLTKSI